MSLQRWSGVVWEDEEGDLVGFEDHEEAIKQAFLDAIEAVAGGFTTLINDPGLNNRERDVVHAYLTGAVEEIQELMNDFKKVSE